MTQVLTPHSKGFCSLESLYWGFVQINWYCQYSFCGSIYVNVIFLILKDSTHINNTCIFSMDNDGGGDHDCDDDDDDDDDGGGDDGGSAHRLGV